jgi:hypothetical protein
VSHQPIGCLGLYGVQQSALTLSARDRAGIAEIRKSRRYPVEVWRIGLRDADRSATAAASLIDAWRVLGGPSASANCAAMMEDGRPVLYIFPRCRLLHAWGWRSAPAIMEMMGVFIATDPEEIAHVRCGHWGHNHFAQVLASLRPPWLGLLKDPFRPAAVAARGAA